MDSDSGYVSVAQFAQLTGFGRRTVLRLVNVGVLPAIRLHPRGRFAIPLDVALQAVARYSGKEDLV